MFEHVAMLLSFVYALAITHLLASATHLILTRDKVRFSGLQAMWMLIAAVALYGNWLEIWPLRAIGSWSLTNISLLFATAVVQYFTCSLVSPKVETGEGVDMGAFYERQRPAFLAAFAGLVVLAMIENYAERNQSAGLSSTAWIGEDLICLVLVGLLAISAFSRPKWLQWLSASVMLVLCLLSVALYTPMN